MSSRPTDVLQPPSDELKRIRLIIDQKDAGAIHNLSTYNASNDIELAWVDYLSGLALFDAQQFDDGITAFQSVVDRAKKVDALPDVKRLSGMSLKKIGWNFRRQGEFQKAYDAHHEEYHLFESCGSLEDLHDACISLDVDSFELKDFARSEEWLERGIVWAEQITESLSRNKCLGMCYNNLSGTLCELLRFSEAEEMNRASFGHWSAYEEESGTSEHRIAWAHTGFGNVYQKWAESTENDHNLRQELVTKALTSYRTSLDIALQQGMLIDDKKFMEERIVEVEKLM